MEPININRFGGDTSSYRLRHEPVKLACRELVGYRPDGDGYEKVWDEYEEKERYKTKVKPGMPRKQKAALKAIPRATVTIVQPKVVQPKEVVEVVLAGGSEQDIKIARLEARMKELLGIIGQRR